MIVGGLSPRIVGSKAFDLLLGACVQCELGMTWVYFGTTSGTDSNTGVSLWFIREGRPDWQYRAVFADTLLRKFPGLKAYERKAAS